MAGENPRRFDLRSKKTPEVPVAEARKEADHYIKLKLDKDGCEVKHINDIIGKGVFAKTDYKKGEFILEYDGELISRREGENREKNYSSGLGSYIFFFKSPQGGKKLCIDGTFSKRMGRFVNDAPRHEHQCNADMEKLFIDYRPVLVLFARRFIKAGEEIRYDYGVKNLPWRCKKVSNMHMNSPSKANDIHQEVKSCSVVLTRLPTKRKLPFKTEAVKQSESEQTVSDPLLRTVESKIEVDLEDALDSKPVQKTKGYSCHLCEIPYRHESSLKLHNLTCHSSKEELIEEDESSINGFKEPEIIESIELQEENLCSLAIMGHFHQSSEKYFKHAAAGSQCTSNCLMAIVASNHKPVDNWNSDIIDEILIEGDKLHLNILQRNHWPFGRKESRIDMDEIPEKICCQIEKEKIEASVGVLDEAKFALSTEIDGLIKRALEATPNQSFILRMFGSCTAILRRENQQYCIFDPHSRNYAGLIDPSGTAGLFYFDSLSDMIRYLKGNGGCREEQVDLFPIFVNLLRSDFTERKADPSVPEFGNSCDVPELENLQEFVTTTKKGKRKSRPKRPCPFCGQLKGRLTDHIKAKHKTEEQVKQALALPKDLRDRAFDLMKKEGIFKANTELLKSQRINEINLIRERNQGSFNLKICSTCKGFFKASMIFKHKNKCLAAEGSTNAPVSLSTRSLVPDNEFTKEYREEILESFRDSEYGSLIRDDIWIKHYGYFLYENLQGSCKKVEKRLSLNSKLRRLAHLFLEFKRIVADRKQIVVESCSEMFNIDFYEELKLAIGNMTRDKDSNKIKNGLKLTLKYLVKDVCDAMHVYYLKRKENKKAEDLGNYMLVLNKSWSSFFKNAEESIITRRLTELRAPVQLPDKSDIVRLRDYTKKTIQDLTGDGYNLLENAGFCKLRDALVSRLTLFNARRGGEPSRMMMSEFEDAVNDKWIDRSRTYFVQDEIEKKLLCDTKVAYLHASKIAKLVPVIIPTDCLKALSILTDDDVRRSVGINPSNEFVFPNTKNSMGHVIGWDCVNRMCQEAGLERKMNATSMRHYIATEYALLDVAARDRELFYKHMGHSETINENIYQCPPAVREIIHVGKVLGQLDDIDEDEIDLNRSKIDTGGKDINIDIDAVEDEVDLNGSKIDTGGKYINIDIDAVEEFFGLMAEDASTFQLLDFSKQVEEEEVTVDVHRLIPKRKLVLNKIVQNFAKKYFTPSAWLAVKSTLKMLEGLEQNQEAACSPEEFSEPSGEKSYGENSSEFYEETGSEYSAPGPLLEDTDSDEEKDCEKITNEEIYSLKGSVLKVKKPRHVWSPAEDEAVSTFFKEEISDTRFSGNKGTLQVGTKIYEFLSIHPEVLTDYSKKERVCKIRTKIINMRRQNRKDLEIRLRKLTK